MAPLERNNVRIAGSGDRAMVFAHGYGCDQNMWRLVEPAFRDRFQTVLFDHVGGGGSDLAAYDPDKYATLDGYADDLIAIGAALDLTDAVFVGHSVSAMIGVLASIRMPRLFSTLVLVSPSPRYIDDDGYVGGFAAALPCACPSSGRSLDTIAARGVGRHGRGDREHRNQQPTPARALVTSMVGRVIGLSFRQKRLY